MKKPLRGAIVGYGFIMEKGHITAYGERAERARAEGRVPDVDIVAVADVCRERRDLAAKRFPGIRVYSDFLELLDAEAGNLDFVDIATPPAKHAAVARLVRKAACHQHR
jgi:predicted dehydrogenase